MTKLIDESISDPSKSMLEGDPEKLLTRNDMDPSLERQKKKN